MYKMADEEDMKYGIIYSYNHVAVNDAMNNEKNIMDFNAKADNSFDEIEYDFVQRYNERQVLQEDDVDLFNQNDTIIEKDVELEEVDYKKIEENGGQQLSLLLDLDDSGKGNKLQKKNMRNNELLLMADNYLLIPAQQQNLSDGNNLSIQSDLIGNTNKTNVFNGNNRNNYAVNNNSNNVSKNKIYHQYDNIETQNGVHHSNENDDDGLFAKNQPPTRKKVSDLIAKFQSGALFEKSQNDISYKEGYTMGGKNIKEIREKFAK